MREYTFYKADPINEDEPLDGVIIKIIDDLPKFKDLKEAEECYKTQAELFMDLLERATAQGFRHQLLIKLLEKNLNLLRYTFPP